MTKTNRIAQQNKCMQQHVYDAAKRMLHPPMSYVQNGMIAA